LPEKGCQHQRPLAVPVVDSTIIIGVLTDNGLVSHRPSRIHQGVGFNVQSGVIKKPERRGTFNSKSDGPQIPFSLDNRGVGLQPGQNVSHGPDVTLVHGFVHDGLGRFQNRRGGFCKTAWIAQFLTIKIACIVGAGYRITGISAATNNDQQA